MSLNPNEPSPESSNEPREPFSSFHRSEQRHPRSIRNAIRSHPIYGITLLHMRDTPNPDYAPESFTYSTPTLLGLQPNLSVDNIRFPRPYHGTHVTADMPRTLPLAQLVTSDTEQNVNTDLRTPIAETNPIIPYLNQDITFINSRRLYYAARAPARPNTPLYAQNTDPIPEPPQYDDPPSYPSDDHTMSRYLRAVVHQNTMSNESSNLDWTNIDPPPRVSNDRLPRVPTGTVLYNLTDDLPLYRAHFLFESIIVLTAARFDFDALTFLRSPPLVDSDLDHSNEINNVLFQHSFGTIPLLILDKHWIVYHSRTEFVSLSHEYQFTCVEPSCPYTIVHDRPQLNEDDYSIFLEMSTRTLACQLTASDLLLLPDYFIALSNLNRPRSHSASSSPLMDAVKSILTSIFPAENIPLMFINAA
jgi:hypothetical protein